MKPESECIIWNWEGQEVRVGYDRLGAGPIVLLLPAMSSISTRREMRPLQERLASDFATIAIDWPGFGDRPRPPIQWQPAAYSAFLRYVLSDVATHPLATIAAGHAASYALSVAAALSNSTGMLCLIAPTWRGPLPTMMGGRRRVGEWITRVSNLPVLGQLLYRLNVNPAMVRLMARGHVYADPDWLTGERDAERARSVSHVTVLQLRTLLALGQTIARVSNISRGEKRSSVCFKQSGYLVWSTPCWGRKSRSKTANAKRLRWRSRQDPCLVQNSWGRVRAPKQQRLFSTFAFNARGNARCSGAGLEDSHSEPQVEVSAI